MRATRWMLLVSIVGAIALLGALVAGGPAQGKKKLVFTAADVEGVDSANPLVGVTVPAYEYWNLMYATLTDKAASDFHTIPGLAQSWKGSPDKRTWTYTLRSGLKWSDGKPLTSEDIAFTINRARKESWLNYTATVSNITATAPNPRTVVLRSSVPDPKLPTMDAYILPKHVWSKYDAKSITKYAAKDGVGSGPFTLTRFEKGQFLRLKANPNYWKGRPTVDTVILRQFNNADAEVAALQRGEIDAIEDVPGGAFLRLKKDPNIETVAGEQGAFNELALNAGDGLKKPHPALLDLRVRQAIAHAIDKKTIVARVLRGQGIPADAISPSALPVWIPKIPPAQRYDFDLAKSRQILEAAGYKDTNGDGIRELPGGGRPLRFTYIVRSDSESAPPTADFITGWLRKIGIATTQKVQNDSQLTENIGKGDYDMFVWGWTPFVDPDPMLSYFTCDQVASDPKNPTDYYNDANWCDKSYDALYKQQHVELDRAKRISFAHQMLTRFYRSAAYVPLYRYPDLQAYRKGRFTGWIRQPANIGPVLFTNSSQTYANLKPVSSSSGGGGLGTGGVIGIVIAAVVVLGGAGFLLARRRTVEERE